MDEQQAAPAVPAEEIEPVEERTGVGMTLTNDDLDILHHLYTYQYLQTRQLVGLMPERSVQGIRRRLRKLNAARYVARLSRSMTFGIINDHAYCLARLGVETVAYHFLHCAPSQIPFSARLARIKPLYLHHSIMVNDTRIIVDQAMHDHPKLTMTRWIAEHELADPTAAEKEKKFVLKERMKNPQGGGEFFFAPDAAFFVHPKAGRADRQMMYCLEADRGTEAVQSRIRDKMIAYHLYYEQARFAQFDGAADMRVLFVLQTPTDRRIDTMRRVLTGVQGNERVFYTRQDQLTPQSFFTEPVWTNQAGERVPLAKLA